MSSPSESLKNIKNIVVATTTNSVKHVINTGAIGMLTPGRLANVAGLAATAGALHLAQKLLEKNGR